MKEKKYKAIQCENCLKVIGIDILNRERIKDLLCLKCATPLVRAMEAKK